MSDPKQVEDLELDAVLARRSILNTQYAGLERDEPPPALDSKVLAAAKAATAAPARTAAPVKPAAPGAAAVPAKRPAPRPVPEADVPDDEPTIQARARPRWILPAAAAAVAVLAVGLGSQLLELPTPAEEKTKPSLAKRNRERLAADRSAAEAPADESAEGDVAVETLDAGQMAANAPPPVFFGDAPAVQDLDKAIALIRKELESVEAAKQDTASTTMARAERALDAATPAAAPPVGAGTSSVESVVQPRERRLAKILELHDAGKTEIASAVLEIFLRDFADDPISQKITGTAPPEAAVLPGMPALPAATPQ